MIKLNQAKKPKILKRGGLWVCQCLNYQGGGINPDAAYWAWSFNKCWAERDRHLELVEITLH